MRIFHIILVGALLFIQCNKAKKQAEIDENIIKDYITKNNIAATRTADGLYYVITSPTNNIHAKAGYIASVRYIGKFMDDKIFDKNTNSASPFSFTIGAGQVILGWDEGIALMNKGEKARLFIPSALAYGSSGQGSIPPNTVLQFEVELVELN